MNYKNNLMECLLRTYKLRKRRHDLHACREAEVRHAMHLGFIILKIKVNYTLYIFDWGF